MPLAQLRRVRWAVRATLALGVAASVAANVLHAQDNPVSQAIAAWPPLALLLTVELISRVPVHRRSLAAARLAATAIIAGIAAWVSYWHMVGVAARYGETGASPYLLPLSVDGLIVVASICLVELGGHISTAEAAARSDAQAADRTPGPAGIGMAEAPAADPPAAAVERATPPAPRPAGNGRAPAKVGAATKVNGSSAVVEMAGFQPTATRSARPKPAARPRRPVAETAALAAAIQADRPEASEVDVARELGITPARLRAVRRQARDHELAA
ncbi:DUF2637 domain-containing protein [Solwaraspora sp. WMMD1047]|uniref:DUF2637 domain-containing protein n=1 Tax=Solwaraspora sp. WMMD1047 TaxID=3016102 RepID=UPI00241661FF|nr:DUF2637 domain-containing protein [Solwaraspora sp. WMMD1047]MDG4829803.1 DUF2637 domain-containing protein [Solwaraspora sp. WMMD1047]